MKEFGDGFGCVDFRTFIAIVTETAIVSSRTLPVGLPLPTISKNYLYRLCSSGSSLALTVRLLRTTPGRTPFHPCAVLPRPASRTHPLPATPFQCPRSRTATLGEGAAATFLHLRWPDCTLSRLRAPLRVPPRDKKVLAHTQVRDPHESAAACSAHALRTPSPWPRCFVPGFLTTAFLS